MLAAACGSPAPYEPAEAADEAWPVEAHATAEHFESGAIVLFTGTTKARCSAVAVGPTTLLTANHCTSQDGARPAVWFMRPGESTPDVGRLITRSVERDLAWVQVGRPLEPVALASGSPGDEVTFERPLWGGALKGRLLAQNGSFFDLSAPAEHGDSGAPVFSAAGELVAVMVKCARLAGASDPDACDPRGHSTASALAPGDHEVSP